MTPAESAAYIRWKTRTNSTTFTDANMLIVFNKVKEDVCVRALETDEDIFLVPTYMDLVEDQREYPFHTSILSRIKRVEAKLDGTNWLKLNPLDIVDIEDKPIAIEANITSQFSNEQGKAFYDIMRKALWIYSGSITDVTDGLRVHVNTYPENVVAMTGTTDMSVDPSTTTHGIPRALHRVICLGVIIEWKESREKPMPLEGKEKTFEFEQEKAIQTLKRSDYDREVIGAIPYNDGSQY